MSLGEHETPNWKSLCAPALLPISTDLKFPDEKELKNTSDDKAHCRRP